MKRSFYLVSYDISDDKLRLKVAQLLEGYGERVQYSLFEIWARPREMAQLRQQLMRLVQRDDQKVGSIRIYPLCAVCRARREIVGEGKVVEEVEVAIL